MFVSNISSRRALLVVLDQRLRLGAQPFALGDERVKLWLTLERAEHLYMWKGRKVGRKEGRKERKDSG